MRTHLQTSSISNDGTSAIDPYLLFACH